MQREILYHDIENAIAIIRFTHNGISKSDKYSLIHVVPGTEKVYADLGMEFDEASQMRAIDYLEKNLIPMFESGQMMGDPEGNPVVEVEPIISVVSGDEE